MSYTAIPSLSDGNILSASWLNTVADDIAYLYSLANTANTPFNSVRKTTDLFDDTVQEWVIRHRLQYYHYKITSQGGPWVYARVYYNGVKIAGTEAAGTTFSGYYDITSWAGLPNLVGAWSSGVAYEDDVNGDGGGGNGDDGSVVTDGGAYYKCKLAHTSSPTDEPGVGVNWTTYWDLLTLPGVGTMCRLWVDVYFGGSTEATVEYLVESGSTSL